MKVTSLLAKNELGGEKSSKEQFALDVLEGLNASPKCISPKYFYDDKGSELFQKITQHSDYYPCRSEFEILSRIRGELAECLEEIEMDIIELGVGDGHKSQLIIEKLLGSGMKVNFYPIDISEKAMALLEDNICGHAKLNIHGVVADYFDGLRFVRNFSDNKQIVLFLGSNIGNFDGNQRRKFLYRLWNNLNHGDFALIGFDLKKDVGTLSNAYDDSSGHTREFNLNLLNRINMELGGTFDVSKFQHLATYNPVLGAMESYLLSRDSQDVFIADLEKSFHFDEFEPIHLEYSFKFLESEIDDLANETGFRRLRNFTDTNNYFVDSLWQAVKGGSV